MSASRPRHASGTTVIPGIRVTPMRRAEIRVTPSAGGISLTLDGRRIHLAIEQAFDVILAIYRAIRAARAATPAPERDPR